MAAIFAAPAKVEEAIAAHANLSIAAVNGSHTVISGPEQSVLAAMSTFSDAGVRCKRLATSHAFHSALMDPVVEQWQQIADSVDFRRAEIPLVCNVSGKLLAADHVCDGRVPILNVSGGTEIGWGILTGTPLHPLKPCAFAGPCLGMGADIVDQEARSVVDGEVGELVLRRPSIGLTRGLWKDPERYLDSYWRTLPDLWVHGD